MSGTESDKLPKVNGTEPARMSNAEWHGLNVEWGGGPDPERRGLQFYNATRETYTPTEGYKVAPLTGAQRVARHKARKLAEQARIGAALKRIECDPMVKTLKQAREIAAAAWDEPERDNQCDTL